MQEEGVAQNVKQPSLEGTRKRKTFWAQCESCESWRRLPKELQKQVDALEFWSVLLLPMSIFALSLCSTATQLVRTVLFVGILAGTARKIRMQTTTAAVSLKRCPTKPLTGNSKGEMRCCFDLTSHVCISSLLWYAFHKLVLACCRMVRSSESPCTSRSPLCGSRYLQTSSHIGRRKRSTRMTL